MSKILDAADDAAWWLRDHLAVAGGLVVAFIAVVVVLATTGGGGGTSTSVPSTAVAVVGTAPISTSEVAHWQNVYSTAATATGTTTPDVSAAKKAAFELLTGAAWITEEAKAKGVTVSDADVNASIATYFKQAGATTAAQKATLQKQLGTTTADMQFQQRVALLASALQEKVANATPKPSAAQIKALYEKEPARWATPTQRDVSAVVTADQESAAAAASALKAGGSFASVSTKYSSNQTLTADKGVIKGLKNGVSGDAIDRAVFSAPVGKLTGPISLGAGYMVFKVTNSTPLAKQTLAQATKAITADLLTTAQGKATNAYLQDLHDRWKAKTRCTAAITDADYCGKAS